MLVFAKQNLLTLQIIGIIVIFRGQDIRAEDRVEEVCPQIVSRLAWGAEDGKSRSNDFPHLPEFVVICHTVTPECRNISSCSARVRSIQNYHMNQKNWDDIAYNFLIGEDGAIYEGRGWDHVGIHSSSYNSRSIGIAFIGTFGDRIPDPAAINIAQKLIQCGASKGKISQDYKLVGHRQVIDTASPGKKLFAEIKKWPRWTSNLINN